MSAVRAERRAVDHIRVPSQDGNPACNDQPHRSRHWRPWRGEAEYAADEAVIFETLKQRKNRYDLPSAPTWRHPGNIDWDEQFCTDSMFVAEYVKDELTNWLTRSH